MGNPKAVFHPQRDDWGNQVALHAPSVASGLDRLTHADQAVTFVPAETVDSTLNEVMLRSW